MHRMGDWRMFLALLSLHWSESISVSCGYWLFQFTTSGFSGPHPAALSWYRSSAHRHPTGQHHLDGVYSRYCLVFAPGCIGTGTRRDQSGEISWTVLSDDRCGVAQLCDLLTDPRAGTSLPGDRSSRQLAAAWSWPVCSQPPTLSLMCSRMPERMSTERGLISAGHWA